MVDAVDVTLKVSPIHTRFISKPSFVHWDMKHSRRFKIRWKIARGVAENNLARVLKAWKMRQSYSRRKWEHLKLLECCSNLLHASVTSCLLCRCLTSVSETCKLWFGVIMDVGGRGVIFSSPPLPLFLILTDDSPVDTNFFPSFIKIKDSGHNF